MVMVYHKRKTDNLIEWINAIILGILPYFFVISNGTNLGNRLSTYEIWLTILVIIAFSKILKKTSLSYPNSAKPMFSTFIFMLITFIISSIQNISVIYGMLLGIMISAVFSFTYIGKKHTALRLVGYVYALITLYILYDFTHGGVTKDWNTNSMGLLASYGVYFMFITRTINNKKRVFFDWTIIFILIISIAVTNSRTTLLGVAIYILFRFFILKSLFYKKWFYRFYYIIVFMLPIGIVNLYLMLWRSTLAVELDRISLRYTEKLFFSGREEIWNYLYSNLSGHWVLGYGKQFAGNSHSLYMDVLYSVGILGLIFYLLFLVSVYEYLYEYCKDEIVKGCVLAFSSIYLMQTFETFMFNVNKLNILPYMILAVALGRTLVLYHEKACVGGTNGC